MFPKEADTAPNNSQHLATRTYNINILQKIPPAHNNQRKSRLFESTRN